MIDQDPDQPPGVEYDTSDLPDPGSAAARVLTYVTAFGDGVVDEVCGTKLFARDLVALAETVQRSPVADLASALRRAVRCFEINGWETDRESIDLVDPPTPRDLFVWEGLAAEHDPGDRAPAIVTVDPGEYL